VTITVKVNEAVDSDLAKVLAAMPPGQRGEMVRRALRHYLLPGGYVDLMAKVDQLLSQGRGPSCGVGREGTDASSLGTLLRDFGVG
jgi:hypothetical protein